MDSRTQEHAEMLRNRLRKNARKLRGWLKKQRIEAFRAYDRDIPEIPLAIEKYGSWAQIAQYQRDGREQSDAWLQAMQVATAEGLGVDADKVVVKQRRRQKGRAQYERRADEAATTPQRFAVREGDVQLWIDLWTYLDTGLFLDHRPLRRMVAGDVEGKRLLNLFCYTGAFTVQAAAARARSTTSVDLSRTYLDWAEDNLALNNLQHPRHEFVQGDVMRFLRERRGRREFDVIVLDPPTFSNSKRTRNDLDIQRDHARLCLASLELLKPGGVLWFSTNLRSFKLNMNALVDYMPEDLSAKTIPRDFRDQRIHKVFRMRAL